MLKIGVFFLCLGIVPVLAEEQEHAETKTAVQLQGAEAVFSGRLHSGLLEFGLANGKAGVLAQYYGSETYRVGAVGISPNLRVGRWLTLSPGFAAAIIKNEAAEEPHEGSRHEIHAPPPYRPTDPAFSFRWKMHLGGGSLALVSEGAYLQALLTTGRVRNFYLDGAHASARFGRLECGITAALANHWEEKERKRGGRLGLHLGKGFGLAGMVLWPGKPDIRGGLFYAPHH